MTSQDFEELRRKSLYVSIVHYPVLNRKREVVTASVTNLDLHDIARSCMTFGVKKYFIIHPSADEQALNQRIIRHWRSGYGQRAHPTRNPALERVELCFEFSEVLNKIRTEEGSEPLVLGTRARRLGSQEPWSEKEALERAGKGPLLLVFGTGYGLAPVWDTELSGYLKPIEGPSAYNHLSVRSAVAIYLDRMNRAQAELMSSVGAVEKCLNSGQLTSPASEEVLGA